MAFGIGAGIGGLFLLAYLSRDLIGLRGQSLVGVVFFWPDRVLAQLAGGQPAHDRLGHAQIILALLVLKIGYTRSTTDKEKADFRLGKPSP